MSGLKTAIYAIIIVVILAAIYMLATGHGGIAPAPAPSSGNSLVALQLTDPPQVPSGTQSLVIDYSSMAVHVSGAQHSGWIQSNASGSIDLLSLLNVSQTLGTVAVPNGTSINMVRFYVTASKITINGTSYNVTLPSTQVTADISGNSTVNASSSVLLSLSPTIVTILTSNSTVFVMVPSVKAVILSNGTNSSTVQIGARRSLGTQANRELERITPNITITGASLSVSGNTTHLLITVKNNANSSVLLTHVGMYGNISVALNANAIEDNALHLESELQDRLRNGTVCLNLSSNKSSSSTLPVNARDSAGLGVNVSVNQSIGQRNGSSQDNANVNSSANATTTDNVNAQQHGNAGDNFRLNYTELGDIGNQVSSGVGLHLNGSVCTTAGFSQFQTQLRSRFMNLSSDFGQMEMRFKQVHFLIASNGTLILPYYVEDFNNTGYPLQSGQSFTFTFNGPMVTSNGGLVIMPVVGSVYTVDIGGQSDARAQTNVTVSAA